MRRDFSLQAVEFNGQDIVTGGSPPDPDLLVPLQDHVFLQLEIQEVAFELLRQHWRIGDPIRALTVGVTRLSPADQVIEQVSLFDLTSGNQRRERQESLEKLVDALRDKHGEKSITLGYQENKEIGVERGETRR